MQRIIVKLVLYMFNHLSLSDESRHKLSTSILDKLYALPLSDIITFDSQGRLLINGKTIEIERSIALRESAKSALQSSALNLVNQQVSFQAVTLGVHKVERPEQMIFARAAIWWGQQQDKLLRLLSSEDGTSPQLDL